MSSIRKKQLERQRVREAKLEEDIRTGRVIQVSYEEKEKKHALPNRLNMSGSVEKQMEEDQDTIERFTSVYRRMLPCLLQSFNRIKDTRAPHKVKHKITVLLLYGIIMFVFQLGSRREINRQMTDIGFENLKTIFPELETLPHADTLARLLENIDINQMNMSVLFYTLSRCHFTLASLGFDICNA